MFHCSMKIAAAVTAVIMITMAMMIDGVDENEQDVWVQGAKTEKKNEGNNQNSLALILPNYLDINRTLYDQQWSAEKKKKE